MQHFEICEKMDKCLHRLEYDDKLAVATSRFHMKSLNIQSNVFCFGSYENIYSYLATFMIRSDFKFKDKINDILDKIILSGLFSKWKKDLRLDRQLLNNEEVRKINKTDLQILWLILFWATIICLLVTLIEIFVKYQVQSKNAWKLWTCLDKFLNGKRNFFLFKTEKIISVPNMYGKYKFNRVNLSQSENCKQYPR